MGSLQTMGLALATLLTLGSFSVLGAEKFWAEKDFDFFTFAQSWPPATCAEGKRDHKTCHIDASIKTWTVHGLWPESAKGKKYSPEDCNSTWTFDFSKVASLQKDLNTYWPNLYNNTAYESFWTHEWEKHGTCAASLQATNGQYNFFKKGLELNKQIDLISILEKAQIVPSDTQQYSYLDFVNAVNDTLNVEPTVGCAYEKLPDGSSYHLIYQILICVSKTFQPMNCADAVRMSKRKHSSHQQDDTLYFRRLTQTDCPQSSNFYYPPIKPV